MGRSRPPSSNYTPSPAAYPTASPTETPDFAETDVQNLDTWYLRISWRVKFAIGAAVLILVGLIVVLQILYPGALFAWWTWLRDQGQWLAAFALGALVGAGEIISRYNDAPQRALFTVPGSIYWAINGLSAVIALLLIRASGLTFGIDANPDAPGTVGLAVGALQVLVAGFGAMAFFRSSFFFANIDGQEVGIGPSTLLQTMLTASDKAVDRTRAKARARFVSSIMQDVSAPKAERSLPAHSVALMQNLAKENQQAFGNEVRTLYDTPMNDQVRVLNLGLLIMNYMGPDVLRAAVSALQDVIRGDNTPNIVISSPRDGAVYGLNEAVKAAYVCKGEPGEAEIASSEGSVKNGELIHTTTLGEKEFKVTAEDKNGHAHTEVHRYIVEDKEPPELISVPKDITVEATDQRGARVFFEEPTATDEDPPRPEVICSHASGTFFGLGTTKVTCRTEDAAGNQAEDYFKVTVRDTAGPTLRLPPGGVIYAEAQDADGAKVSYEPAPSAIDSVDGAVDVSCDPDSGSVFAIGKHTVRCWAIDKEGNKTEGEFEVVVRDTTAPDLKTPGDITIEGATEEGVPVKYEVSATDVVDGNHLDLRCDPPSGSVFPLGKTVVICTASDKAGNEATRTFTVSVEKGVDDTGTSVNTGSPPGE